jgi:hypothetical protein
MVVVSGGGWWVGLVRQVGFLGGAMASSNELAELVNYGSGKFSWQCSVVRDLLL